MDVFSLIRGSFQGKASDGFHKKNGFFFDRFGGLSSRDLDAFKKPEGFTSVSNAFTPRCPFSKHLLNLDLESCGGKFLTFPHDVPSFQLEITKHFESRYKLLQMPMDDIIFLHNLFLEVEDYHLSLNGTKSWENIQQLLLNRVSKLREASQSKNASSLPEIIRDLKIEMLKLQSSQGFESRVPESTTARLHPFNPTLAAHNDSIPRLPIDSTERDSIHSCQRIGPNLSSENRCAPSLNPGRPFFITAEKYFDYVDRLCELFETMLLPSEVEEYDHTGRVPSKAIFDPPNRTKPREVQPVFFVTSRNVENLAPSSSSSSLTSPLTSASNRVYFGMEDSNALTYGISNVKVFNGKASTTKENQFSFTLSKLEFLEKIKKEIQMSQNKSVLLYIHGCFTTFSRAIGYGARISHGLDFDGPILSFSWPTGGRPQITSGLQTIEYYRKDEISAVKSARFLKEVIQMAYSELGAKNIHIVAFSMGNRTLIEALDLLKSTKFDPDIKDTNKIEYAVANSKNSRNSNDSPEGDINQNALSIRGDAKSNDSAHDFTAHLYFMAPDVTARSFSKITREFKFPSLDSIHGQVSEDSPSVFPNSSGEYTTDENATTIHSCSKAAELEMASSSSNKLHLDDQLQIQSTSSTTGCEENSTVVNFENLHSTKLNDSDQSSTTFSPHQSSRANLNKPQKYNGLEKIQDSILEKVKRISDKNEVIFSVLEKLADSSMSIFEDNFTALQTIRDVWTEGRTFGWGELLQKIFGPEEHCGPTAVVPFHERKNFHMHLYAARNDIALLLSELIMDVGPPEIRAGRKTKEFLLCSKTFNTIDASLLRSGFFTTGHFYILHRIVQADMKNCIEGKFDLPWWRKMERWQHKYDYFELHPKPHNASYNCLNASTHSICNEISDAVTVNSSPLIWMCS